MFNLRLFLRDEGLKEFEFRNLKHLDFVGRFTLSLKHSFNWKDIFHNLDGMKAPGLWTKALHLLS